MGIVYKARQKSLARFVALKLLAPERVADPDFSARFAAEARALAALNHPHIVTIHDFGQAGGFYYLLMELVDGVNLRRLLEAGRLSPEAALAIVPSLCDAMQYAHEHGIVHRDIKPENLLLDKEGRVKVADFGIAKLVGEASSGGPIESRPVGTPQYMAPEQKRHGNIDHRADIYSLGLVLYEMLTGELPTQRMEPVSRKVQVDVRLDEIVLRALATAPERRYQTAAEMKADITAASTPNAMGLRRIKALARQKAPFYGRILIFVLIPGIVALIAARVNDSNMVRSDATGRSPISRPDLTTYTAAPTNDAARVGDSKKGAGIGLTARAFPLRHRFASQMAEDLRQVLLGRPGQEAKPSSDNQEIVVTAPTDVLIRAQTFIMANDWPDPISRGADFRYPNDTVLRTARSFFCACAIEDSAEVFSRMLSPGVLSQLKGDTEGQNFRDYQMGAGADPAWAAALRSQWPGRDEAIARVVRQWNQYPLKRLTMDSGVAIGFGVKYFCTASFEGAPKPFYQIVIVPDGTLGPTGTDNAQSFAIESLPAW